MLSQIVSNSLLNPGNTNIKPGLERMKYVLEKLGNPQHKYKVIHITGTNGKGSTSAFIYTGLIHAGFKTGKFMSPHILRINECITINNKEISDNDIERIFWQINNLFKAGQSKQNKGYFERNNQKHDLNTQTFDKTIHNDIEYPSPFELLTLIMFQYMAEEQVEYLILEAGMGGETDCTNVVDSLYSIITNIGLEHTQWLGDTLDKIAINKAGIIKNGKTIIADNGVELLNAVKRKTNNYVNVLEKYQFGIDLNADTFQTNIYITAQKAPSFSNYDLMSGKLKQEYSEIRTGNHGIDIQNVHLIKLDKLFSMVNINQQMETLNSGIMNANNVIKNTHLEHINYKLGLYGKFQAYNFMIAYEIFKDLSIPDKSISFAAENTFIPYRFQVMERDPVVIYDITHNLSGAIALVDSLKDSNVLDDNKAFKFKSSLNNKVQDIKFSDIQNNEIAKYYSKSDTVFITAILGDKDIVNMLEVFSEVTNSIIFTEIKDNPRAVSSKFLSDKATNLFENIYAISEPIEALKFAKSLNKNRIIVCGSSYIFKNLS